MVNERIERLAETVLKETDITNTPINVVPIANFYGFSVFEADMDSDSSGLIIVDDKNIPNFDTNKLIVVNKQHSPKRKRFTTAHELGHYFLNSKPSKCYAHREVLGSYNSDERDANQFASALLMPQKAVKAFYEELKERYSKVPNSLAVSWTAIQFDVSEDAARVRLSKLGLI